MFANTRAGPAAGGLIVLLTIALTASCSSKSLEEAVEAAKQSVEKAQKTVESAQKSVSESAQKSLDSAQKALPQVLPTAVGSGGELQLESPQKYAMLAARVIPAEGQRPAVLQIASSFDPAAESFPALFIQAEITGDPAALAGQTLTAQVYAAAGDLEQVWRSPADKPVQLRINAASAQGLTCELLGADLERVDQPGSIQAKGVLTTTLLPETTP